MPAALRPEFSPRYSFGPYDAKRVGHRFFTALRPARGVQETFEQFAELIEPKPTASGNPRPYQAGWI